MNWYQNLSKETKEMIRITLVSVVAFNAFIFSLMVWAYVIGNVA